MKRSPQRITLRRAVFVGTLCLILSAVMTVGVAWGLAYRFDWKTYSETWVPDDDETAVWQQLSSDIFNSSLAVVSRAARFGARLDRWTGIREDSNAEVEWTVMSGRVAGRGMYSPNSHEWPFDQLVTMSSGWPARCMQGSRWTARCPLFTDPDANLALRESCDLCGKLETTANCFWCTSLYGTNRPISQMDVTESGFIVFSVIREGVPELRHIPLRPIVPGLLINTLFYSAIWFGLFFGVSATRRTIRRKRGRCPMCGYDLRGDLERGCSECGWNREP